VHGELGLVGGEAEGEPGGLAHREGFVKLGREGVEVGCERGGGCGRVGDDEGDRSAIIDLGGDSEGKGAVCIPKDTSGDVGEGGCDPGRLLVLGGGRTGSVESSFGGGERLRWLDIRHSVAGCRDFGGRKGALILSAFWSASPGGLGIRLLGLGAVRGKVTGDERGGVRVFPFSEPARFP